MVFPPHPSFLPLYLRACFTFSITTPKNILRRTTLLNDLPYFFFCIPIYASNASLQLSMFNIFYYT